MDSLDRVPDEEVDTSAEELYNRSRAARGLHQRSEKYRTLSVRIYKTLRREGKLNHEDITPSKLLEIVKSGEVWMYRNIGEKSVMEICKWIVREIKNDNHR